MDLKNVYLNTPLNRPEYVRIMLTDIPQEFIEEYKLNELACDSWSTLKCNVACTPFPKQASLLTTSSDTACCQVWLLQSSHHPWSLASQVAPRYVCTHCWWLCHSIHWQCPPGSSLPGSQETLQSLWRNRWHPLCRHDTQIKLQPKSCQMLMPPLHAGLYLQCLHQVQASHAKRFLAKPPN